MIDLINVTKTFQSGTPGQYSAVAGVSLTIRGRELTVLKGPSGSGKTTLLSLVGCMSRPTSGRIILSGIDAGFTVSDPSAPLDIASLPERFMTGIRRRSFGFVFQHFNLIRGISTLENILLPAYPSGGGMTGLTARGLELLRLFGLERHARLPVELLSGGELQRAAIARALINDPAVIIADEPTAHLDSRLSAEFMEILGRLKGEGKTVLVASHDPLVCDSPLVDRVVEMRDGRLVQ